MRSAGFHLKFTQSVLPYPYQALTSHSSSSVMSPPSDLIKRSLAFRAQKSGCSRQAYCCSEVGSAVRSSNFPINVSLTCEKLWALSWYQNGTMYFKSCYQSVTLFSFWLRLPSIVPTHMYVLPKNCSITPACSPVVSVACAQRLPAIHLLPMQRR